MALIRAFELRAAEMYQRAKIGGYCHINLGEEATVVGLMAALEPRDYLFTTYREHGYALARGLEPGPVMAELFGEATGVSAGRGGLMHLFDKRRRLLGGYGIVGGQIPPATGAALALTYRGEPGPDAEAVMCLLGDGTTNIGSFHESLNLAALWHLPIVYVIVNNGFGNGDTGRAVCGRAREEGFVGAAIGAAMLGMRPVVELMTINFSLLAIDQIVNHAAKMHAMFGGQVTVPMVIRTPGGGGQQLAATHSQNLEVWYAHVPGMKVVALATPADAKALLTAAIRDDDPVLFLENLALYNTKGEVPDSDRVGQIGSAAVVRPGQDLTVVSYSRGTVIALEIAAQLAHDGVFIEVIDLRSLQPLDRDTVCASARKTSRVVVLEDDWLSYGIGAEIAATVQEGAFDYLDAPVRRVAAAEVPLPYAKALESAALPTAADLAKVIGEVLDATRFTR